MEWITNEFLFYGGIAMVAISLVAAVIYGCISKVRAVRLDVQLDIEYGRKEKK